MGADQRVTCPSEIGPETKLVFGSMTFTRRFGPVVMSDSLVESRSK